MKTLTILIGIVGLQCIALGQPSAPQLVPDATYSIAYSEDTETLTNPEATPVKCNEIVIMTLPPATQSTAIVSIEFGRTGSFTFKKDAALEVHENVDVYIEDMVTGRVFDLKSADSYTFSVNRRVPNRFVLHIDKLLLKYALSSR